MKQYFGKKRMLPVLISVLLTGCIRTEPSVSSPYPYLHNYPQSAIPESIAIRQMLLAHHNDWDGVRYRFGGNSKRGIDCSAYTVKIYKDLFNHSLNRRVVDQRRQGEKVRQSDILPGDLVFFNPDDYPHHVGVALGDGRFLHVSSKKGVTISKLHSGYWSRYFSEARRVIN